MRVLVWTIIMAWVSVFLLAGIVLGQDTADQDTADEVRRICASEAYRAVCGQTYEPETDPEVEKQRRKKTIEDIRRHEQEWLDEGTKNVVPPEYPTEGPS